MNDDTYSGDLHPWIEPELEARLVALILGEASDFEREELERLMDERPELAVFKRRLEAVSGFVRESVQPEEDEEWKLSEGRRKAVLQVIEAPAPRHPETDALRPGSQNGGKRNWWHAIRVAAACLVVILVLGALTTPAVFSSMRRSDVVTRINEERRIESLRLLDEAIERHSESVGLDTSGGSGRELNLLVNNEYEPPELPNVGFQAGRKSQALAELKENLAGGEVYAYFRGQDEQPQPETRAVGRGFAGLGVEEEVAELAMDPFAGEPEEGTVLRRGVALWDRDSDGLASIEDGEKLARVSRDRGEDRFAWSDREADESGRPAVGAGAVRLGGEATWAMDAPADESLALGEPVEALPQLGRLFRVPQQGQVDDYSGVAGKPVEAFFADESGPVSGELRAGVRRKSGAPASAVATNIPQPAAAPVPPEPTHAFGDSVDFGTGWGSGSGGFAPAEAESRTRTTSDFIPPVAGTEVAQSTNGDLFGANVVTGGLRSGDAAITRNSIDAILNNPDRAAVAETEPGQGVEAPVTSFAGLAGKQADMKQTWDVPAIALQQGGEVPELQDQLGRVEGELKDLQRSFENLYEEVSEVGSAVDPGEQLLALRAEEEKLARLKSEGADETEIKEVAGRVVSGRKQVQSQREMARMASQLEQRKYQLESERSELEGKLTRAKRESASEISHAESEALGSMGESENAIYLTSERQLYELEREQQKIEGQIKGLLALEDEELMRYAAGLDIPSNGVPKLYEEFRDAVRGRDSALASGLGESHPSIAGRDVHIGGLREDLEKATGALQSTLQTQLDLTEGRLGELRQVVGQRRDAAVDQALESHDYIEAKQDYENAKEMLQKMKLQQTSNRIALRIPRAPITIEGEGSVEENKRLFAKNTFTGTTTLQVHPAVSELDPFSGNQSAALGATPTRAHMPTEFKVVASDGTLAEVVKSLDLGSRWGVSEKKALEKLKKAVDVKAEGKDDLLSIEVELPDEEEAELVSESIAREYIKQRKDREAERAAKALAALDAELQDQAELVEEKRKVLDTIVQAVGIPYVEGARLGVPKGITPRRPVSEDTAAAKPFSTFSLHVSDVSFKLAQAALEKGEWPEAERVRTEEFVNAFDYQDPTPTMQEKVACQLDQAVHPFAQQRNLLRVSMRAAALGRGAGTPLRLTVLVDNSGSMDRADRAASVQRAFDLLAAQLHGQDEVTLISFARTPRLVYDSVSGDEVDDISQVVGNLQSEGGTNLEAALQLASNKARANFLEGAQNRIILLTDGAANLGNADPDTLRGMVETLRDQGIAFDACGVGADGLNDEILESLTRKGDGRYYFLDRPEDADDGFAKQIAGALRPAAQNVKVQVEFNPKRVGRYKLYGFEKHELKKEDFRNDSVDAAELAAEEAGVAVYQVETLPEGEGPVGTAAVRFRDMTTGQMVERSWEIPYEAQPARMAEASAPMRLAGTAALFAERLKGTAVGDSVDLEALVNSARSLPGLYPNQDRIRQFIGMIEQARQLGAR